MSSASPVVNGGFDYGVGTVTSAPVAQAQYSSNDDQNTLLNRVPKNRCCCWCAVGFLSCITLFLLLFFLIPRPPRAKYESSVVTFNPYVITQTYSISNWNMYSLTLSNLDLEVTTSIGGDGVVGHGTFTGNSSSITIPKNSKKEVSVVYNFDTTTEENNLAKQACFSASGLKYVTSGTIDMETWVTDFNDVSLGPWSVTYYC